MKVELAFEADIQPFVEYDENGRIIGFGTEDVRFHALRRERGQRILSGDEGRPGTHRVDLDTMTVQPIAAEPEAAPAADHRRDRFHAYAPPGDQLDAIAKGFAAMAVQGVILPAETQAWLDDIAAVKARFPKDT